MFGSKGFLDEGRRLFDLAEQAAADFKTIQTRTADFHQSEWGKIGVTEDSPAEIVSFTLAFDDFEDLRIFAYLNEVEPDPDNLLTAIGKWSLMRSNPFITVLLSPQSLNPAWDLKIRIDCN